MGFLFFDCKCSLFKIPFLKYNMHSIYKKEERGKEGGGRIIHKLCNTFNYNIKQLHTGSSLLSFSKSFLECHITLFHHYICVAAAVTLDGRRIAATRTQISRQAHSHHPCLSTPFEC